MGYYLIDNPNPNYKQYRTSRRGNTKLSGGIILHDTESGTDLTGGDNSAENCAAYIARRSSPGSYHTIVDRDSTIRMVPYEYEVWQDTTSNRYTVGVAVAYNKVDLGKMTRAQRDSYYAPFARAVLDVVDWFKTKKGIIVPTNQFLSRDAIVARKPGLSTHSRMDPSRRSDPFGTGSVFEKEFLEVLSGVQTGFVLPAKPDTPAIPAKPDTPAIPAKPAAKAPQSWTNQPDGTTDFPATFEPLVVDENFGKLSVGALQILMHAINMPHNKRWDGALEKLTWSDVQLWLRGLGFYEYNIDGVPGEYTIRGLQKFLKTKGFYQGYKVDGHFGPKTAAAFQQYLNTQIQYLK